MSKGEGGESKGKKDRPDIQIQSLAQDANFTFFIN